ncbi:MAG: PspC domain-containing protein, partial [Acidimicrobiales bacterium]
PPGPGAPRLHRSSAHRLLGGVAGGLGERFDLDPNIVRVAFVVLSVLWGFGVALYLAMWVLIPRDASSDAPTRDPSAKPGSRWPTFGLLVVALLLGLLLVLAIGHGHRYGPHVGIGGGFVVLWLVFLIGLAFVTMRGPRKRSVARVLTTLLLAFVSVIVVLGGAFAIFVATTGVPITGGIGSRSWAPISVADTRHSYRTELGSSHLDLSAVRFPAGGYTIDASVAVGVLTIELPAKAVVDVRSQVGGGSVRYGVVHPCVIQDGYIQNYCGFEPYPFSQVPAGLTGAAIARAPHLHLVAQVGVGRITIERAP